MSSTIDTFVFLTSFLIIALASRQIGNFFAERLRLPKISGFLFTGLIAGPFVLRLASVEAVESLRFVEEISLAYIAFAAGSELYLPELRGRFRSIGIITGSLVVFSIVLGTLLVFLLGDWIPFMADFGATGRFAIALLAASIMVARSPSVAIAIINELRARGPFSQIALGVTVISDVFVIILFAFSISVADALLTNVNINVMLLLLLLLELALSLAVGYLLSKLLQLVLSLSVESGVKMVVILALGLGVYTLSAFVREFSHSSLPFEILLEPLLICMVGSFLLNNYSKHRIEFMQVLHDAGPMVYVAFFTLVGEGLKLEVLAQVWPIALAIFGIRALVIIAGSLTGGVLAGEPKAHNSIRWMVFVTQAGVALGLAKEVAVEFPGWGDAFATTIIAAVVINEIAGPLLFKFAVNRSGESHVRAEHAAFDGVRDAIIFGLKPQALTLARQLQRHGWEVKIATSEPALLDAVTENNLPITVIESCSYEELARLDAANADTIVTLLTDEMNLQVCELAYERFGVPNVVVQLEDRQYRQAFVELGALIVEPETAVVSLLEHFVRSPVGTSMLLGMAEEQDIVDIEVRNPALSGTALRDLGLPLDVLVLSVNRDGQTLISHGYTKLHLGDKVTMVGSQSMLDEVMLRFDA